MKRKICVVTGSRAEYGLLKPLLDEIKNDSALKLQVAVTGSHLSAEFGLTRREIEGDGFFIDEKVKIVSRRDEASAIANSMALSMEGFTKAYENLKPDLVVLLGDRYEIFGAAAAACVTQVPIAHIHGGELTRGVIDDAFRHAITKMSHMHFTAAPEYRERVIQLGEDPDRVFNVGALGLDNIKRIRLLSEEKLQKELKLKFNKRNLLVTFHPVTLERDKGISQFKNLLSILDTLKDTTIIFTKANADTGGKSINRMIDRYAAQNSKNVNSFASLGQLKYLSAMQFMDAVVGNSSSGIIEAPSFRIGTINIGDRQEGRIRADSVIDCAPTKAGIKNAFKKLYSKRFKNKIKNVVNPYRSQNAARQIKDTIKKFDLADILKKRFYDIDFKI